MSKAPRARSVTVNLEGDDPNEPQGPTLEPEADSGIDTEDYFRVTDEIRASGAAYVTLVRVLPRDAKGYAGRMDLGEFTAERAMELYGPGTYKVRVFNANGKFVPGGGTLELAGTTVKSTGGLGDVKQLFEMLDKRAAAREADQDRDRRESKEKREQLLLTLAPAAIAALPALFQALRGGSDNTTALIAALKPPPAPTLAEVVATMQGLQSLNKPTEDPTDKLVKLLEVAREIGGGEKGETSWLDLVQVALKDGLPALKSAADAVVASRGAGAVPGQIQVVAVAENPASIAAPVSPGPAVAGAPDGATLPPGTDVNLLMQHTLKQWANKLVGWASSNKRPDLYAEVFLDEIPEWMMSQVTNEQVIGWLEHPQWWEIAVQFEPRFAPHKVWAEGFRAEVISLVKEQIREE